MSNFYLKNRPVKIFVIVAVAFASAFLCVYSVNAQNIFPKSTYSLPAGKSMLLAPSAKVPRNIIWSSSDSSMARVDSFGVVYGVTQGKAEITAINLDNNETSKCFVEVGERDSIRIAFTSSNMVDVGASFDLKALTNKNVESVRFEIREKDYNQDIYCNNRSNKEGLDLWSQSVKLPRAGTYKINTYAKTKGSWKTCSEGHAEIFVANEFNDSQSSLVERRVSLKGADFITSCEGFCPSVYKDSAGFLTIGYGKLISSYEPFYNNLSKIEGQALFSKTLNHGGYTENVNKFLISNNIKFNQQQFDALVSFSYNLGCGWMSNGSDLSKILLGAGGSSTSWYGTVNSDNGLFIRSSPSTSAKRLRALRDRTRVDILNPDKQNGSWYHVRTADGLVGYCYGDYLKVDSVKSGDKDLNLINKDDFINEFSLYHHSCKKCYKGLLARRFYELDIFLYGVYSRFRSEHFSYGNYPIPECAKNIM